MKPLTISKYFISKDSINHFCSGIHPYTFTTGYLLPLHSKNISDMEIHHPKISWIRKKKLWEILLRLVQIQCLLFIGLKIVLRFFAKASEFQRFSSLTYDLGPIYILSQIYIVYQIVFNLT